MTERRQVVLPALVALALVTIAAAAALSGGQVRRLAGPAADGQPIHPAAPPKAVPSPQAQPSVPPAAAADGRSFDWVLQVLLALVVVAAVVTIAVLVLRLSRRRRGEGEPDTGAVSPEPTAAEQARLAVRAGLADLGAPGSDPRGVVIGCWLALERAAAAVGLARRDTDSPTDLVVRLLAGADVPAAILVDLAALYRAARYAPDDVTDSSRERARQALTEVALALERGATNQAEPRGREPAGTFS